MIPLFSRKPIIIGVTGSTGTGKTTVARMFAKCGAYVIDADKIVHHLLDKSMRKALAGFVFDEARALRKLCRIIHPLVKKKIFSEIKKHRSEKIIVIDAPLLIESGLNKKCDYLVVVKANFRKQLKRSSKSLSLSQNQVRKRIRQQMPLKRKIALADFVIDNTGSVKNTEKQVRRVWKKWKR